MPKLTKSVVESAKAGDKEQWLWDTDVPGFGVRIQPGGRKTYVIRYRNALGRQRKMTIGRACDMAPDKAREEARKKFAAVAAGRDPAMEKQELKSAPTIQELRDRYQREWAEPFKKPRSCENDVATWERYILPKWSTRKVAEITKADVLKLQGEMAHIPAAANQMVALLGKAFNLAEDWSWRPQNSNPCYRLKKYKLKARSLILTTDQVAAFDQACTDMVADGTLEFAMASLARLWLITGCRNSEIRTARRAWIDRDLCALKLPDSKTDEREIPLPPVAMDIIEELDKIYGADRVWLIPGRRTGDYLRSPWQRWKKIAERAGIPSDSTPHTLRHTVGSIGHRAAGLTQKQVQMQLGHKRMSTTERYIHGNQSEQAVVATKVADVITVNWKTGKRVNAA